jgi:hypothetical protein
MIHKALRKTRLTSLLSLCTAGAVCASPLPCVPPPPPELWLTIASADPTPTRLRVGQEYVLYMSRNTETTYLAAIFDKSGAAVYRDRPVRWSGCVDGSVVWPVRTTGSVRITTDWSDPDGQRIDLVADAHPLSPCVLALDLSAGVDGTPARPNPGIPDTNLTFCPPTRSSLP